MQQRAVTSFLIIIKHHHARCGKSGKQFAEEIASEYGKTSQIFGRQCGQCPAAARCALARSESKMIKERSRIVVACVDLIPKRRQFARVQVTRKQSSLA